MKFICFPLLLIFTYHICVAQYDNANKKDSLKILDAKYEYRNLEVNKNEHANTQLPYGAIEFKDVRYDTSFIAIIYPFFRLSKNYNVKLDLSGGFAKNVSGYFNNYYLTAANKDNNKLVCFIKKFSITFQYELLEHYNTNTLFENKSNFVNIDIECFYKRGDTLYPAIKLDTSYLHQFNANLGNVTEIIKELFQPLMEKMEQADIGRIIKRKGYSELEINKRYTNRFNLPILTTNIYKKGIYKSFAEFKNNKPSIDSFSISTDKLKINAAGVKKIDLTSLAYRTLQKRNTAIFLYDKNNELISPSTIFGYCDGEAIWIQHGAFFYPLERISNSFEFMYIYHYSDLYDHTNTMYILSPLNMETGKSN